MDWLFGKNSKPDVIDEVKMFIKDDLFISKTMYRRSERSVEEKLIEQLEEKFGCYPVRSQLQGKDKLKCDVDLFNKGCGIELKLARSLERADEFQRAIGQIACYALDDYKDSGVILLVIGEDEEKPERVKKIESIVKHFRQVHVVYKQALAKRPNIS